MTVRADLEWLSKSLAGDVDRMVSVLAGAEGALGVPSSVPAYDDAAGPLSVDMPDQFPAFEGGQGVGEWPDAGAALGGAQPGDWPEAVDHGGAEGALGVPDMPQQMPQDADYPVYEAPPQQQAQQGGDQFQFANWTERDGSVVFEDGGQQQMPQTQGPEPSPWPEMPEDSDGPLAGTVGDIFGMLEGIKSGIDALSGRGQGGGGMGGLNLPTGASQMPWGTGMPGSVESREGYSASTPGVFGVTSLSGLRGAGGHGAGSGMGGTRIDLTEPGKRLSNYG